MTAAELRALGLAIYGVNWQSPLARAIGVSSRTIRRYAAGDSPIPDGVAADIRRVIGAEDIGDPDWPQDRWIIGDGATTDTGARREYIVHTRRPRFIGRVVALDRAGRPLASEYPADIATGVRFSSGPETVICEVVWIDPPPTAEHFTALMEAAADAIDEAS